jgi:hypothetical protein
MKNSATATAVAAFLASMGMALAQTTQAPYRQISSHLHLGEGAVETINGRRALATADEVIE